MDTVFHKYLKIKQLGDEENEDIFLNPDDEIVIEEKIDGANFRFTFIDGKLVFGSRNRVIENEDEKNWKRCIQFVKDKVKDKDLGLQNYIFYGECCIKHSLEYDWENIPIFLGFDIYDKTTSKFMANKNEIYTKLDLPTVPHIITCYAGKIGNIDDSFVPDSKYTPLSLQNRQAEGVVFKNYDKQIFAKYVRKKFKEVNKRAFGGGKKFANDDSEKIVAIYCTNARIDKIIFKLMDEGFKLNKKIMTKLPTRVYNDIISENWKDILTTKYVIDVNRIRKLVAKRCLAVLDQVITNNIILNKEE